MARKPKDRSGHCDACEQHSPSLCAVRTTIMLCQRDAKRLMIEGAYLQMRVVVTTPDDGVDDALASASLNAREKSASAARSTGANQSNEPPLRAVLSGDLGGTRKTDEGA